MATTTVIATELADVNIAASIEDAVTLIRHILIGDEVRRSDMLASVIVDVEVVGRSLVALPFDAVEGRLTCAVTGVTVRVSSR